MPIFYKKLTMCGSKLERARMNCQFQYQMVLASAPLHNFAKALLFAYVFKKQRVHIRCFSSPLSGNNPKWKRMFQSLEATSIPHPNIDLKSHSSLPREQFSELPHDHILHVTSRTSQTVTFPNNPAETVSSTVGVEDEQGIGSPSSP